jgi:hypothetical protein
MGQKSCEIFYLHFETSSNNYRDIIYSEYMFKTYQNYYANFEIYNHLRTLISHNK